MDAIVNAATREGLDADSLLRALGLERSVTENPDRRVPIAITDAAWSVGARLGPEDLPLRAAATVEMAGAGLLGYLLATSSTVRVALTRLVRYFGALSSGTRHQLEVGPAHVRVTVELVGGEHRSAVVETYAVAVRAGPPASSCGSRSRADP